VICGDHASSTHHVYPKGQGGDDTPANFVSTCGDGTKGCHGMLTREDRGARWSLGQHLVTSRPDVIAYVKGKLGEEQGAEWLRLRLFIESPK
jgi:hypothetical protein